MRRFARISRRLLMIVLVGVVGFWVYLEGQQWLTRLRAERLLKDLQGLECNRSSWIDAQRLMSRWGKFGGYNGTCSPTQCGYTIAFDQAPPAWMYVADQDGLRRLRWRPLLDRVGIRPARVFVGFNVRNSIVKSKFFLLDIDGPLFFNGPYLTVSYEEGPRLAGLQPDDTVLHPYHAMESAKYFIVAATPKEDASERAKLMRFRLDCLTVLRPCLERSRILPEAYDEFRAEAPAMARIEKDHSVPPFWISARDQDTVLVADVLSAKLHTQLVDGTAANPYWVIQARATDILKGQFTWPKDKPFSISIASSPEFPSDTHQKFPYGKLLIAGRAVSGKDDLDLWGPIMVDESYIVGCTSANLAAAKRGVREDYQSDVPLP